MAYSNFYAKLLEALKRIGASFVYLWRYYPSRIYLSVVLLFQVAVWWQAIWIRKSLVGELLVLRYKIDFGANLIGEPGLIFIYPVIALLISVLNVVIAASFYKNKNFRVFAHLLLSSAAVFGLFISLYLLSVFLINFR